MNQGNKRTPQRFVGREAIVTTQCLNGWLVLIQHFLIYNMLVVTFIRVFLCLNMLCYFQGNTRNLLLLFNKRLIYRYVVKTLDNAESVKLQYRSLAKVLDDPSKPASSKMAPNWLQICSTPSSNTSTQLLPIDFECSISDIPTKNLCSSIVVFLAIKLCQLCL